MGHKISFFAVSWLFRGFAGLFVFLGICFLFACLGCFFFKEQNVTEVLEGIL